MAASDEWDDFHLTPNGWVGGSSMIDFGTLSTKEQPSDTLLTRRYRQVHAHLLSEPENTYKTKWKDTAKENIINELLIKFPHPEDHYKNYISHD